MTTMEHPSVHPAQPTVNVGDIVRVHNHSSKPLKMAWDSRQYTIPPDASDFVPYECAKLYFGDSRSTENVRSAKDERGVVGWIADRMTEIRRLRLLWNHPFGEYIPNMGLEAFDPTLVPNVDVTTLHGEKIWTVLDDPDGVHVMPAQQSQSDQASLLRVVQQQGQLLEVLMQRLGMGPEAIHAANLPPIERPPSDLEAAEAVDLTGPVATVTIPKGQMVYDPKEDDIVTKVEGLRRRKTNEPTPETLADVPQVED